MKRRIVPACRIVLVCFAAVACVLTVAAQTVGEPMPQTPAHQRVRRFLAPRQTLSQSVPSRALAAARRQHLAMPVHTDAGTTNLSALWTPVGPAQVQTDLYGPVTGRVTSLALDPADATGNTVYVGTTGGGVWKSTNAAGPAAAVVFNPLTDTLPVFSANAGTAVLPSLSIGALAMANGVLLAGTGDPNDATDSLYGAGILRSTDGGATWTLVDASADTYQYSFFGLAVAGFAFSSANPALVVAALTQSAEGTLVNAADANFAVKGLYYSADAGRSWHLATLVDGAQVVQQPRPPGGGAGNAATAVVWNPVRQRFYAAIQFHGYYESPDGMTWTRLAHQPGAGLTTAACPPNPDVPGAAACPILRGALAVEPVTGDTFALTTDARNSSQGFFQDACSLSGTACASPSVQFDRQLSAAALETDTATHTIAQADYNLVLAAIPTAGDTTLYAGTIDLFRCSLATGCVLRNTTNAQNGCLNPARVTPAQHALAALGPLVFVGNDGGLYRSADGVAESGPACNATDATHFQNLNPALGSLAEVISFAQHPSDPKALLAGLGALGTAATATASGAWPQLATGEGGTVAIDAANPQNWYLSSAAGVNIAHCGKGAMCTAADFTGVLGAAQVASDLAAIHAPWLLDPAMTANLLVGTCRAWRGPAAAPTAWSVSNAISRPFGVPAATGCSNTFPVVRSLAAGGPAASGSNVQNAGSVVLYAGLAGTLDGGQAFGGHIFTTAAANVAGNTTVWTDIAGSPVTNDFSSAHRFNPGGFDISSIAIDPHDTTGQTVYATVMGFTGNGVQGSRVYRSLDAGAHWTAIASNLPQAPANSIVVDPNDANTLYVALDTGVYVTTQVTACATGDCWSIFGSRLPNAPAIQLLAGAGLPTGDGRLGELRVATYGRGIWQIPLLTAISPASPAIALSPASLTFASQQTGTLSLAQTITMTNTGNAPLLVSSILASGDFLASTATCTQAPVPQAGTCTIDVRFAPSATGARNGLLTVYGNVAGGQATAALTGTATPPAAIVLTPTSLSFPATTVGATSAVQRITVANTGGTIAHLQAPAVTAGFTLQASTCAATLAPATSCTVSVVFAPTTAGPISGTLTQVDDAGTQVATLAGSGTSPATDALSQLALAFAPQSLGTISPTQQITLTNAGDVPLLSIAVLIASGDFTAVNGCGNSLAPHSACTFTVAFVPKTIGAGRGTLAITDQFRTQSIALTGTGLAPAGVSLSPLGGLAFGPVGLGLAAPMQTVTLTNHGGVPLAIASIVATGDFALAPGFTTCSATLAPDAVCTVAVAFSPMQTGPRTGLLTFTSNAATSPESLALSGTGIDFSLSANSTTTATVATGHAATYALLLRADASLPGNAVFTCAGVPAHATCTVNPTANALAGTTVITVTVATGVVTAALAPPAMPWTAAAFTLAAILPLGLLLPLGLMARRRRRLSLLSLLAATLLVAVLLGSQAGCSTGRLVPGDGGSPVAAPVTPAGTYAIVVSGSSTGLVRSVNLTLVVQ